jgi:protein-S-isoprenylcysteine O-methyltransferase Ste14
MMNEPDKSTFFVDLQRLVVDYVKTRLELTQLVAFEKISKIVAYLVIGLILALLFFFGLLFASVVLGIFLSDLLGSTLVGFGIIALIYLLVFMVILSLRNKLIAPVIINSIIKILYERSQSDEDEIQED